MAESLTDLEILRALEGVVHDKLDWRGGLQEDMLLAEDMQLDSLQLMTLAVEVENHFRIILNPEDEAGIQRVSDLVRLIGEKTGATAPISS